MTSLSRSDYRLSPTPFIFQVPEPRDKSVGLNSGDFFWCDSCISVWYAHGSAVYCAEAAVK